MIESQWLLGQFSTLWGGAPAPNCTTAGCLVFLPPGEALACSLPPTPRPCAPPRLRLSLGHFPCFFFYFFLWALWCHLRLYHPRRGLLFHFADPGGLRMSFLCNQPRQTSDPLHLHPSHLVWPSPPHPPLPGSSLDSAPALLFRVWRK